MKQLFVIFLLLFLPVVTFADNGLHDSCVENGKYKSEYTIDKRCYVTDEQKQISPYNAVVRLTDVTCTGTIVKRDDGYFLYTAKHCTDSDYDNQTDKIVRITLQDGRVFSTNFVKKGDAVDAKDKFGDWAYYKIPVDKDDTNIPYVKTDSFKDGKVRIVGYGSLEILSDNQIKQAKDEYVKYLIEQGFGDDEKNLKQSGEYILTKGGGIKGGWNFRGFMFGEFYDGHLKVSNCELSKGGLKGCQLWGGNSGGPLFNSQGGITGIVSTGNYNLGGTAHAGAGLVVGVYSDNKNNGKQRNWVASSGDAQTYFVNQAQYYEQQEKEAEREAFNTKVSNNQMSKQIEQQNKMQMQDTIRQNKQMMMNMNKQYQ